jgi:hypothetical protein
MLTAPMALGNSSLDLLGRRYSKNSITLEFTVSCTYILYSKTKTVNSATSPKIVLDDALRSSN